MKKATIRILLIIGMIGFISTQDTFAQKRVGGGFSWGSKVKDVGINFNAEIFVKDKIAISPNFIYYFVGSNLTYWELNGDVHYYFQGGDTGVYGIGGLNITHRAIDIPGLGISVSDSKFGLNVGAGYNFDLEGPIIPFGEVKYIISNFDQLVLSAGIRIGL